jgi:hypothetical protein
MAGNQNSSKLKVAGSNPAGVAILISDFAGKYCAIQVQPSPYA